MRQPAQSVRCLIGSKCFLLIDNDPNRKARHMKSYLHWQEENGVLQQMVQPQEIPDLRVSLGFHEEAEAAETA